jgi:CspA family cold shock protein
MTSETETLTGVIRKLRDGYGFIAGNDGTDYFIHWTSIAKDSPKDFRSLSIGDRVEFQKTVSAKGPRGIEVRVIG